MDHRATIRHALCQAQDLLWENLPSIHHLTDGETIEQLRQLICSRDVAEALRSGPDCELAFYLRAGARVLADDRWSDREIITKLWPILDNQALNQALDVEQAEVDSRPAYKIVTLIFSNLWSRDT